MSSKVKSSFVKGALILAAANIIVKIIGAVFRIPLTNLVGTYGMGLYSASYKYYSILLTIATAGLPIAISKMISESRALGRYRESSRIFKIALISCAFLGLFGTLFMLLGSGPLAEAVHDRNATLSIIALSPAVLFISVAAAYRGYFQGHGDMLPTALSQVLEALSRLFVGLFLAILLLGMHMESKYIAAGTITGVTIGTALSAALLYTLSLFFKKKQIKEDHIEEVAELRTSKKIFLDLMSIAIPVTIGALIINLTGAIDLFLVTNRLAVLGYDSVKTTSLFGVYDNLAVPLFNLVPSIIISLNVSITPVIAATFARRDFNSLYKTLTSALRIIIVITLPAAIGLCILAGPILGVLFTSASDVATATPVLSIMSIASFFLCASSLTSTVMQALGKANIPVYTMITSAIVKVIANYVLIAIPGVELNGAAIGTILCYIVITVLNLISLAKIINFKPSFRDTYLKPLLSSCIMGIIVFFAYYLTHLILGDLIALTASIGIGGLSYLFLLFKTGGITREDVLLLPKGEKIAGIIYKK